MATVEEDIKTLVDAQWSDPGGLTKGCHVFLKTDPDVTEIEPPAPGATSCFIIIMSFDGVGVRFSEDYDKVLFTGEIILFTTTYANASAGFDELDSIFKAHTTGNLQADVPKIEGDVRESSFFTTIPVSWVKLVAR